MQINFLHPLTTQAMCCRILRTGSAVHLWVFRRLRWDQLWLRSQTERMGNRVRHKLRQHPYSHAVNDLARNPPYIIQWLILLLVTSFLKTTVIYSWLRKRICSNVKCFQSWNLWITSQFVLQGTTVFFHSLFLRASKGNFRTQIQNSNVQVIKYSPLTWTLAEDQVGHISAMKQTHKKLKTTD